MNADLHNLFLDVLEVDSIGDADSVDTIPNWDSVRHLNLMLAIEERFGVQWDAEQMMTLTSVAAVTEALGQRAS